MFDNAGIELSGGEAQKIVITVNHFLQDVANTEPTHEANGTAIIYKPCHQADPNCSTVYTDAGWPLW